MRQQPALAPMRLRDLREPDLQPRRDPMRIYADLAGAGWFRKVMWPGERQPLDYDHLVVAEDKLEGRAMGMLGANTLAVAGDLVLFVDFVVIGLHARGRRVLRRLLATALMQAARSGPVPRVLAVRSCNPVCYRAARRLAADFGAALFPDVTAATISLPMAGLASQIARQVSPHCRFEPGSGVVRGALAAHGLIGAVQPVLSQDAAIDAMHARHLGLADQFLLVVDLRALRASAILDIARRIRRRR